MADEREPNAFAERLAERGEPPLPDWGRMAEDALSRLWLVLTVPEARAALRAKYLEGGVAAWRLVSLMRYLMHEVVEGRPVVHELTQQQVDLLREWEGVEDAP